MSPLQKFRDDRSLSLTGLVAMLDDLGVKLSASQLNRIEREGTHSLPTAIELAKATGLTVEDFAPRAEAA